jgi:hypothetical protein
MKYILLAICILPFISFAQDCEVKSSIDPYTRETKVTTGFISFNTGINNFLLTIDATKADIDFFIAMGKNANSPCFDNNSTLSVLFEGSRSKSNFRNSGSMNCEGLFHFNFRNNIQTNTYLKRLSTVKIQSLVFTGSNGKIKEIFLNEEDQLILMEKVTCMIAEAKALLPQQ